MFVVYRFENDDAFLFLIRADLRKIIELSS